ncbi:hypothetical protein [Clostridium grantii]|uniref:Uncharacterized protein n=1 Tax=Clostridium grantii DSM 8605 TaxID=1121316 RepID=A0A1M5UJT6_9CLOT|nr:hypothetical protein [Clostridium grantii]SHH63342.1 hypothetical protein SAMN02745207_01780 [Clostridium grantii DSM 8605]
MSKKSKGNILSEKNKEELEKVNMDEYGEINLQDKKKNFGKGNPVNSKK